MNKNSNNRRSNDRIKELLNAITPVERLQINTKMTLAARLDDLISTKGWSKSEFANAVNKNPSEITKWLSGTQNFTIDTLAEIAITLDLPIAELFAPKRVQVVYKQQIVLVSKVRNQNMQIAGYTDMACFSETNYPTVNFSFNQHIQE